MALNLPALHRWHRRIALASAPLALAWALSGFIHPILSSLPVSYTHLTLPTIYSV